MAEQVKLTREKLQELLKQMDGNPNMSVVADKHQSITPKVIDVMQPMRNVYPPAPAAPTPAAAPEEKWDGPELPDYDRSGTNWMAAAIPMISQFLIGGKNGLREGAGGASKTLLTNEKNRSDFNQKLMALANSRKQRKLASEARSDKGRYQLHNMFVDGQGNVANVFDTATADLRGLEGQAKGYKMTQFQDSRTKDNVFSSGNDTTILPANRTAEGAPGTLSKETSPFEANINAKIYKDTEKKLEPQKAILHSARTISALLEDPNGFSTTAIGQELNKMFEGKGRMTDADANRYVNPATYDAIVSRLNILSDGRHDPKVESELRQLISTLAQNAKRSYSEDLDKTAASYAEIYPGIDTGRALKQLYGEIDSPIQSTELREGIKKSPAIQFAGLKKKFINGKEYWFKETSKGKWEQVD